MVGAERRIRNPVVRMEPDGKNRRVIPNSTGSENLDSPPGLARDRKRWRAESANRPAGAAGPYLQRACQVGAEFLGVERGQQAVRIAVGSDLMAAPLHFLHQVRKTLSHPAQDKERCLDVMMGKQIEQDQRVAFHARWATIP